MDCHSLIFFKPASAEAECRIIIHILLVRLGRERVEGALVFSYGKLDFIWPPRRVLCNEVIKAELDQMERISVKWSESQYLPSACACACLPPLNNYRAEEQKRAVTDRFYFSCRGRQSC